MPQIIVVRQEKCEDCLYSNKAVVGQRAARWNRRNLARKFLANGGTSFRCHCHEERTIICQEWYETFKKRLTKVGIVARFTRKKGSVWQHFRFLEPGAAFFVTKDGKAVNTHG